MKHFIDRPKGSPFIARDGALIFELFRDSKSKIKNLSIATGTLKPKQKAIPHHHRKTEEIYYVLAGRGKVLIGKSWLPIRKGDAIFVPLNTQCALHNTSLKSKFEVLAISSPPYTDSDMIFTEVGSNIVP